MTMAEREVLQFRQESERYLPGPTACCAGDLSANLEAVEDGVPLAWMYTRGDCHKIYHGNWVFYTGLWGRAGQFYREKKTFVDAFDWEEYQTEGWQFSPSPEHPGSVPALELHPLSYGGAPQRSCVLETAGDLKRLLGAVAPGTRLLAPSRNFELKGALADGDGVKMYSGQDIHGREYLFLALD
ncbi:MAG: hypothetical protein LUD83_07205 [Clostridiales bacterium]|nr:hypothetical protein [Clostridiales bacterium]